MSTDDADRPIRLLHLSDLHFGTDREWDADPVRRALTRLIAAEVAADGAADLVVITGDIAETGAAEEYARARRWFEADLWPVLTPEGALPLSRERLLMVPGNHDVSRPSVDDTAEAVADRLLGRRDQDLIARVLADPPQRAVLVRRHAAYLTFYADWLQAPADSPLRQVPWWTRTFDIRGTRLHCAGLDTALLASGGEGDRNRLLLGRWQLHEVLEPHADGDPDWRIALLHHPLDYLAEFDGTEARQLLDLHCHLVLRGHLRQSAGALVRRADHRRDCLELAAGSVYAGSDHTNACQWIELHTAPRRVRVHYRCWAARDWTHDRKQPGCPTGTADYPLDPPADGPVPAAPPPPADPTRYLEHLLTETAHIDIRGLVTGRPDAHRFPIGDLYIELQATGAAADPEPRGADPGRRAERPLHEALVHPRLAIVGDPGCGKTTFLRWIAHCLATDRLGRDPGAAARRLGLAPGPRGPRLPILVPIADWLGYLASAADRGLGPARSLSPRWLADYLGTRAADDHQGLTAEHFTRLLTAGDAMLLFDGLDEAPDPETRRHTVALIEHIAAAFPDCPLVVTSRPAAYQGKAVLAGFAHCTIEALDDRAIAGFLARWSRALFPERPARAAAHQAELTAALASRREIRRLARNTVMLTALAVVHWNDKRIPEQRAELYESILRWLAEAREQRPGRAKPQHCRYLLGELALAMHTDPRGRQVQVGRRQAAERLAPRFDPTAPNDPAAVDRAETFLAEEELDSGIIVRRGPQLRFWHLTFQEYLAACALAGRLDGDRAGLLLCSRTADPPPLYRPEWRESVLLLGGVLYTQGPEKVDGLITAILDGLEGRRVVPVPGRASLGALVRGLFERAVPGRRAKAPTRADQARAAGLIGALVRDLAPFGYQPADPRYAEVLDAALAVFDPQQAAAIPLPDRIAAAEALAQAGDPRLGWNRPDRWVELPGGVFWMGAQRDNPYAESYDVAAGDNDALAEPVRLSAFRIGRFPVTVTEFAAFLDDDECSDPCWWKAGGKGEPVEPDQWDEQLGHPSRPVVFVSWYQAMAYCAWLTHRVVQQNGLRDSLTLPDKWVVRLPTEDEWEYAARGKKGRKYPWGAQVLDAGRVNSVEAGILSPSPVGVFPDDSTPEGILDMAGNVEEWCRFDRYGDQFSAGNESGWVESSALRGGSFSGVPVNFRARNLRAINRNTKPSTTRSDSIGFRCVLAEPCPVPPVDS